MHGRTDKPDYLAIGHITRDLLSNGGANLGGTVTYAALTAQRLGQQAAIVTSCATNEMKMLDPLRDAGVWLHIIPSQESTTFQNIYDAQGNRAQIIGGHAADIDIAEIPDAWREAGIVHLAPVAQEIPAYIVRAFSDCLLGVTPQGWMRTWDVEGHVTQAALPLSPALTALPENAVLVASIEDMGNSRDALQAYVNLAPLVVITQGGDDALIWHNGTTGKIPACHAKPIDPTGAGDVFAAAFFVMWRQTRDIVGSARFAHAAAACAIEDIGINGIPTRDQVQTRQGIAR
ncbi:MAG: PfkB family carbohydrate kinase [Chloroflexota bacterium]|nr:PfkB family carbohydrate kinase [Chloroflexota bacterium]